MEKMILRFAASARAAGLRVSTAEVLDCLRCLPRISILDETQFATLLRAHFAKSRLEQARFNHLYHLFFHEFREDSDAASASVSEHMAKLRQDILSIEPQMQTLTAIADFLAVDPESYLQLLREMQSEGESTSAGSRGLGSNLGNLIRRLPVLRALQRAEERMEMFLEENWREIHWETREQIRRHTKQRLETARRLLTEDDLAAMPPPEKKNSVSDNYGELGQKAFANLSPGELIRLRDVITKLVRKLRDMSGRSYKTRSRGIPDIRKTLRAAMRTQGIPMELRFRQKPPRKSRILVLCDVSGSVWSSARFMLTMLYSLQDCFERVKTFAFVDEPVEISHFFEDSDIDRALEEILQCPDIAYGAPTDYGRMLRIFKARHTDSVNKKTTVIVIGDGRSNYGNPEEDILEEIRERSRRLLWLNPESERFWNSGDSEMQTYEKYCNEVRYCENLNQLSDFIQELVL